jgi:hypothetical protein
MPARRAARTTAGGGCRLQRAALAGIVGVGAVATGHRQVGDLARDPVRAAEQLVADDQAHADARADVHEREAVHLPAVPVGPLGQGRRIHVVLHHQGLPEHLPQARQHRRAVPAGQAAGEGHGVAAGVVDTGAADDRLGHVRQRETGLGAQALGQADQFLDPAAPAGGVRPRRGPGPDLAGQVGEGAADVLRPHVQAEHEACLRPDLIQQRGPARPADALARFPDQARLLDGGEGEGHGGLGQPGQPGQVGAGAGAVVPDVPEQKLFVERPDELGTRGRHSPWHARRHDRHCHLRRQSCPKYYREHIRPAGRFP